MRRLLRQQSLNPREEAGRRNEYHVYNHRGLEPAAEIDQGSRASGAGDVLEGNQGPRKAPKRVAAPFFVCRPSPLREFRTRVTFILAALRCFPHSLRPCPGTNTIPAQPNTYGINI